MIGKRFLTSSFFFANYNFTLCDYWNYLSDDTKLDTLAKADADGIMSYINANY